MGQKTQGYHPVSIISSMAVEIKNAVEIDNHSYLRLFSKNCSVYRRVFMA